MKIRNGFVSNSSSSSFIIAFDGDEDKLEKKIKEIFGIKTKYPIKFPDITQTIMDCIGEKYSDIDGIKEFMNNHDMEDEKDGTEVDTTAIKYLKKGWTIYTGEFDDQNDAAEAMLCNSEIEYKDKEIYIWSAEGY